MLTITTCLAYPEPPSNLLPLAEALTHDNIPTAFAPWQNRPKSAFILPLCAWDYAAEPEAFGQWLTEAEACGQRFINPVGLMRWNMDKRYLCDLAEWGADVIPSVQTSSEKEKLEDILKNRGWREAVVKPVIGQSGRGVAKIRAGEVSLKAEDYPQGVIVQPYIREIETAGETSLVFFDGHFSHAVLRMPPQGEWRANSAYGVAVSPAAPPEKAIETARQILSMLPEIPAYARIDGTLIGDRLLLNELELIEPALYLHTAENAVADMAQAVKRVIAG